MIDAGKTNATPSDARQRMAGLDALRGLALFGILFVNLTWFTGFAVTMAMNPDHFKDLGTFEMDTSVNWLVAFLVDSKFWSIFALLFGIGLGLQTVRYQSEGKGNGILYFRLAVLFVLGMFHGIFVWFGDIISLYALTGFLLLLFARLPAKIILVCGIGFLLLPILQSGIWLVYFEQVKASGGEGPDLSHGPFELLHYFPEGNLAQTFEANWAYFVKRWVRGVWEGRFFKLLGMFLLGLYLVKANWITAKPNNEKSVALGWWFVLVIGFMIGLPCNYYAANHEISVLPLDQNEYWVTMAKCLGVPALAMAYVAGFFLVHDATSRLAIWRPAALVGRMSLTNYVIQSLVGVFVFYGCGLGYWGSFGITWSFAVIVGFVVGQTALSALWLRFFAFGPLEWVARCATYRRILPLRRRDADSEEKQQ